MYKSLVVLSVLAVSANAYIGGKVRTQILYDFETASMELDGIREKYGMRSIQAITPYVKSANVGDWT